MHSATAHGLSDRWQLLAERSRMDPARAASAFDGLVAAYSQPHRAYHTLAHIADVFARLDWLGEAGARARDLDAVEFAAWFHDVVYDPLAVDNEEASAQAAVDVLLGSGVAASTVGRAAELVLATKHHEAHNDDAAMLVDADLAVLGSERAHYLRYAMVIREEYADVEDDVYRNGRVEVLMGLAQRPRLYATAAMRSACEQQARANMRAEIDLLVNGSETVAEDLRRAAA